MISPVSRTPEMNLLTAPAEGIQRGMAQVNAAAQNMAAGAITPENVVGMIEGSAVVKANAVSSRVSSDLVGTILDTFA